MSEEDEKFAPDFDEQDLDLSQAIPLLPIRNAVLFPGAVAPFDVGREKSVALVEDVENQTQPIIVVVVGVLAILALILNFYNMALIQGLTGATQALVQDAAQDAASEGLSVKVDELETKIADMQKAMDEAKAKMESMAAEGDGDGAMEGEGGSDEAAAQ